MLQSGCNETYSLLTHAWLHRPRTGGGCGCDYHPPCGGLVYESQPIMKLHPLLHSKSLVSDQVSSQEVSIILNSLEQVILRGVRGAVVEFGCYVGTTSLFIRRLLDAHGIEGAFHVYDSFEGLPEKTKADMSVAGDQFLPGELRATKKALLTHFYKAGLKPPVVHKGWFKQLTTQDVPDQIMFAFLDGDYYDSIRDSLSCITHKLLPGAVIVVDDYANEALPGARRAVNEWMHGRSGNIRVEASLAIIQT